jgi:hypothetical protein
MAKFWTLTAILTFMLALPFAGCKNGDEQEKLAEAKRKAAEGQPAPESDEAAPLPTGKKFTDDVLKKLGTLDVPGFDRTEDGMPASGGVSPVYISKKANASGVKIEAWVHIGNCIAECLEFSKESIEAKKNMLPEWMTLSMPHRENPKLVYEIGEDEVDKTKVITTYLSSYVKGQDPSGKHSLALYFNEGVRQLRVTVNAQNLSAESEEDFKAKLTKDELTAAAKQVFEIFLKFFF